MPSTSVNNILRAKNLPPLTFLFGFEEFLIEEAINKMIGKFVPDYRENYNFNKLTSSEIDLQSLFNLANSFPMLADEQFIIIKGFEKYFKGRISKDNKNLKVLNRYLENIPRQTKMIILCQDTKLDGMTKKRSFKVPAHYKSLLEKSESVEFPKVYPNNYASWLESRFAMTGKKVDRQTIEIIISSTQESLRDFANQVDKIASYAFDSDTITGSEIMSLVGQSKENNVFELQKSISARNITKSIEISENMLTYSKQEIYIVSALANFFKSVLRLSEIATHSTDKFEIARVIGASPYFMEDYYSALRNYSLEEIENIFLHLTDADLTLKSTSESGLLQITQLLVRIMGQENEL